MNNVKLPVGISDFHKLRQNEYYYVDKTNLIKELLESRIAEVTLITRPRRFGKTIGMSMLAYFFDIRKDSRKLFEDLKISRDIELCQKWMNQYPTLFISFKDVDNREQSRRCGWIEFSISYEDVKKSDFMDLQ